MKKLVTEKNKDGIVCIRDYDDNGNLIYYKDFKENFEIAYEYDNSDNGDGYVRTVSKRNNKYYNSEIYEYKNNKTIHHKLEFSDGYMNYEEWWDYDENGNMTHYKDSEGKELRYEYNNHNDRIYSIDQDSNEKWYEYTYEG